MKTIFYILAFIIFLVIVIPGKWRFLRFLKATLYFLVLAIFILAFAPISWFGFNTLPKEAAIALDDPGNVIIYSLDWYNYNDVNKAGLQQYFKVRGEQYKVLGKADLNQSQIPIATGAFKAALSNITFRQTLTQGDQCFSPTHALRVTSRGHIYDFFLSIECGGTYYGGVDLSPFPSGLLVYKDDKELVWLSAGGSPDVLNGLLTATHVPLPVNYRPETIAAEKKYYQEKKKEFPDTKVCILALLEWLGSGGRQWSQHMQGQEIAVALIFDYSTKDILDAIQDTKLTENQTEGLAFVFGSITVPRQPQDLKLLSPELKKILLDQTQKSTDPFEIAKGKLVFGQ